MKKGLIFAIAAIAVAGFAGLASAGLPCAAYSICDLTPVQIDICSTTDVIWDPNGNDGYIQINVTVKDCLDTPVDTCTVRLDISGEFLAHTDIGVAPGGYMCNTGTMTAQTNANGAVSFQIDGGGCGSLVLNWSATAECASPEVLLCSVSDTLCVKSTDLAGNGLVNFFDTFNYLPLLGATVGYAGDFAACSAANQVNFFDTFTYLPALGAPYSCPGGTALGNTGSVVCDTPLQ